jgi:hypothetical protein
MAYWAAFNMHDFKDRPRLFLWEQDVCKKRSNIRLYCMALSGQDLDLWAIYRRAQVLVREAEITNLQCQPDPEWVKMYWETKHPIYQNNNMTEDDLPF